MNRKSRKLYPLLLSGPQVRALKVIANYGFSALARQEQLPYHLGSPNAIKSAEIALRFLTETEEQVRLDAATP